MTPIVVTNSSPAGRLKRVAGAAATQNPEYMLPSSAKLTTGKTLQARAVYLGVDLWPVDATGVTWSTSDAGVATVSSSGLITPVALGSCTITAAKGAASVTMAFTVASSVTVAYILMQPLVQTVPQNGRGCVYARPYDVDGTYLPTQAHTWTTSNVALGSLSVVRGPQPGSTIARKLIAGTTEGVTTITASNSGVSGTMTLTVSDVLAPAAPTTLPNLPTGWTIIRESSLSSVTNVANYSFVNAPSGFGEVLSASDATAVKSGPQVMRLTVEPGRGASNVNAKVEVSLGASYETLYFAHWFNKSANWATETAGSKQGFFKSVGTAMNHYWGYDSDTAGNDQFAIGTQFSGPDPAVQNYAPYCARPYDRWRLTEVRITGNTAGNYDGRIQVWIDGVRIFDRADMLIIPLDASPRGVANMYFGGTYSFPSPSETIYEQFDHIIMAVP